MSKAADYWNLHLEHNALRSPPHGKGPDTDAGAFLAWHLEAAGDIIRETSKGQYADSNYIFEKFNRLKNHLTSRDWSDPLSHREIEALRKIREDIEELPADTELLEKLKIVLLAIADRNPKLVESNLDELRRLLKEPAVASTHPLVLERFPYPSPEQMGLDIGGIGELKVVIPPPRGTQPTENPNVFHVKEWPEVKGIFVGGCVKRGTGSSFRAKAHAHNVKGSPYFGWICVRSLKRVGEIKGDVITKPSQLLWHEYAHILTPNHPHDDTWRQKMRELGQPITEQYRKKPRPKIIYKYICPSCQHRWEGPYTWNCPKCGKSGLISTRKE